MEDTYVSPEAAPEPKKNNTLLIVILVIVGLILLCCCCLVVAYFGLLASGFTTGDAFSNILQVTPVY
jgi:flagellar basal body-associated protein FliL